MQKKTELNIPEIGFIRMPQVLGVIPVSRGTWLDMVKDGRAPKAVKLGPRIIAWRVEDIRNFIASK